MDLMLFLQGYAGSNAAVGEFNPLIEMMPFELEHELVQESLSYHNVSIHLPHIPVQCRPQPVGLAGTVPKGDRGGQQRQELLRLRPDRL